LPLCGSVPYTPPVQLHCAKCRDSPQRSTTTAARLSSTGWIAPDHHHLHTHYTAPPRFLLFFFSSGFVPLQVRATCALVLSGSGSVRTTGYAPRKNKFSSPLRLPHSHFCVHYFIASRIRACARSFQFSFYSGSRFTARKLLSLPLLLSRTLLITFGTGCTKALPTAAGLRRTVLLLRQNKQGRGARRARRCALYPLFFLLHFTRKHLSFAVHALLTVCFFFFSLFWLPLFLPTVLFCVLHRAFWVARFTRFHVARFVQLLRF